LTVAGASFVAFTSAADVASGCFCKAWCTASADTAARPSDEIRSRSALTKRDAGWTYDMTTAEATAAFPWLQAHVPRRASAAAMWKPIPAVPPVMSAVLPACVGAVIAPAPS